MNCLSCGLDAGYNRAVVDLGSGVRVGGFCRDCERAEFGRSLGRGHWERREGCALCPRDGLFALPRWLPRVREVDGDLHSRVEFQVTDATPRLCDEHLHALSGDRPRVDAGGQVERDTHP